MPVWHEAQSCQGQSAHGFAARTWVWWCKAGSCATSRNAADTNGEAKTFMIITRHPVLASVTSALLAVMVMSAPAHAQQAAPQTAPPAAPSAPATAWSNIPALADFEKAGGIVEYIGRVGSLDGFVMIAPEQPLKTVYITPERHMVMGILVNENGENLTAQQLVSYRKRLDGDQSAVPDAEKGSLSKSEQVYAATEKAAWVSVGDQSAPYVYMFMNVNCDHCKAMFTDIMPLIRAKKMQVRLVPFGTADANRDGGAALLSVADPLAAWQAYINGDQTALGKDKITAGALEKIAANTKLFNDNKMQGPPFTLYRRPSDGVVTAMVGRVKNTLALMADLLPPELPPAPAPQAVPPAPEIAPEGAPEVPRIPDGLLPALQNLQNNRLPDGATGGQP